MKERLRAAHHRPKKTLSMANRLAEMLKKEGYQVRVMQMRDGWWVFTVEEIKLEE